METERAGRNKIESEQSVYNKQINSINNSENYFHAQKYFYFPENEFIQIMKCTN